MFIQSFGNRILKSISFSEFIVIMFAFIALFEVHIVICEEMIVILWANYFVLHFSLYVFIRIIESCLVLFQLIVVIFIVEIFRAQMSPLSYWVSKFIKDLLEACFSLFRIFFLERYIGIYVKQLNLLIYIINGLLEVTFLPISRKVEWLKR